MDKPFRVVETRVVQGPPLSSSPFQGFKEEKQYENTMEESLDTERTLSKAR